MTVEIRLPALGPDQACGRVTRWHVEVGARVEAGDLLADIASGRATMEIEAPDDGVVTEILIGSGPQDVAVGAVLARFAPQQGAAATGEVAPAAPKAPTERISFREALRDALADEMRRDDNVFVLGDEVGDEGGAPRVTEGLLEIFSARRVVKAPISGHGFAGLGVGAALAGLRPVIEFTSFNFALQALDHIVNTAAKARYMSGGRLSVPIVFRGPNGGRERVGPQHAQDFSALFSAVPGLKVVAPFSAADARALLIAAIRDPDPVVFLEHEKLYERRFDRPSSNEPAALGRAAVLRPGAQVSIIAWSHGVALALAAAERLAGQGVSAEVLNLRSLRPLDSRAILASVAKTGRCVVVEEGWPLGGLGAEIAALVGEGLFGRLKAPVRRVNGVDAPMPYAANLEALALPDVEAIAAAARKSLSFRMEPR